MKRLIVLAIIIAALIATAVAAAYPSGGDGPLSRGSCQYYNTWQAVNVGGPNPWVCYPDGYWHEQRGGWDLGIRAD